jgi:hypothetical protein
MALLESAKTGVGQARAGTTRLRRADPADMGAREPYWAVRPDMNARLALL